MILFIPHTIISAILVVIAFQLLGWDTTASRLFLGGIIIFTLLWPLFYLINKSYFRKLPKLMNLIVFFFKELIVANFYVAYDVLTPTTMMRPCIIALPLSAETDYEITILANMISLTPGTLSLDLSEDRKILFVHAIQFNEVDTEKLKSDLKNGFEKKLLEITR